MKTHTRATCLLVLSLLAACGGAAPPASQAPESPAAPGLSVGDEAPMSVDAAVAELDRAEADLRTALGGGGTVVDSGEQKAPATDAPPGAVRPGGAATPLSGGDACGTACRALASMRRAVDHLCGLAGEGDGRCEGARARVGAAAERVQASCAACSS